MFAGSGNSCGFLGSREGGILIFGTTSSNLGTFAGAGFGTSTGGFGAGFGTSTGGFGTGFGTSTGGFGTGFGTSTGVFLVKRFFKAFMAAYVRPAPKSIFSITLEPVCCFFDSS